MNGYQTQTQPIHHTQTTSYLFEPAYVANTTCVFLHGRMSAGLHFGHMAQQLAHQGYRVICSDIPGFAHSDAPLTPWTINTYAQRLGQLLDTIQHSYPNDRLILIGHSFGGRIIIEYLSNLGNPHHITKAVLISSGGLNTPSHAGISQLVNHYNKTLSHLGVIGTWVKKLSHRIAKRYLYSSDHQHVSPMMQDIFDQTVRYSQYNLLPHITIPTLLLRGEQDDQTPLSDAHIFAKQIPTNTLLTIPHAGHFSYIDDSVTTLAAITQFIGT